MLSFFAGIAMPLILDTYNIIHAGISMGGAMSHLTVRNLCHWLRASPLRQKAMLVLDGRAKPDEPSANEFPEIQLVYSGAGISADSVIAQRLQRALNRRRIMVVTNDRAVQAAARRAGAHWQSCEAFLSSLMNATAAARSRARHALPHSKTHGSPSPGETDHWLKEFGITLDKTAKKPAPKNDDDLDMKKLMGF